jgi:hypothetical protein
MKVTFMAKGMETNAELLSSLLCSFICFHGMDLSLEIAALSHYLPFYTQWEPNSYDFLQKFTVLRNLKQNTKLSRT